MAISRARNLTPCIGVALVVLGQLRIAQALQLRTTVGVRQERQQRSATSSYTHLLRKAKVSLQRALSLEGLEAEDKNRGTTDLGKGCFLDGRGRWSQASRTTSYGNKLKNMSKPGCWHVRGVNRCPNL